jgi:hypothetical protein
MPNEFEPYAPPVFEDDDTDLGPATTDLGPATTEIRPEVFPPGVTPEPAISIPAEIVSPDAVPDPIVKRTASEQLARDRWKEGLHKCFWGHVGRTAAVNALIEFSAEELLEASKRLVTLAQTVINTPPERNAEPRFVRGDKVWVPVPHGRVRAIVVSHYGSRAEAGEHYIRSYETILKRGPEHFDGDWHYLCEIDNLKHEPIGVSDKDATKV